MTLWIFDILSGFQGYDLRIGQVDRLFADTNDYGRSHLQNNLKGDRRFLLDPDRITTMPNRLNNVE